MAGKKKPKAGGDKHTSNYMVRLPEPYRATLKALKAKTGQPYTEAVRRAVDAYLTSHGITPPPPMG